MKDIHFRIFFWLSLLSIICFSGCQQSQVKYRQPLLPKEFIEPEISGGLTSEIVNELNRYNGVRGWRYIVIHHSATDVGNAAEFDRMHREVRGWDRGLGYHFVIGNGNGSGNGTVEIGSRWINQIDGAHAGVKEYNRYGIGICLVGNFEGKSPTYAQISTLIALINYLQYHYNIPSENVILHKRVKNTACPGEDFPYFKVLSNLRAY